VNETAIRAVARKEDGMQYILLIYGDESAWGSASPEEQAKNMQEWVDYTQFLKDKGYHIAGDALHPTSDATTVRVRDGKTITTDGPFAVGPHGTVEIRPVAIYDEEGRPSM
jgi:hypothetical protein